MQPMAPGPASDKNSRMGGSHNQRESPDVPDEDRLEILGNPNERIGHKDTEN